MSVEEHTRHATPLTPRVAVVTLSDTRTPETDGSGAAIKRRLAEAGFETAVYALLADEPVPLRALLIEYLDRAEVDAIICNGGTGVSRRDQTVDVVSALMDIPLPGFGEIFRQQSFAEVGPSAMLSRATAGIACGKPLFALPGSTPAVELGMRLILPVMRHLVFELRK